jgi:Uma2 family endonuclease
MAIHETAALTTEVAAGRSEPALPRIPPLETGDHLTRDEFERRYQAMPDVKKAELIEGVVYMASAVRARQHGNPHARLMTWLGVYDARTAWVLGLDNSTIRLDLDNEPQPDGALLIDAECGGQASIGEDDYIEGAPELVVEVSASSASIDLNTKLRVYRRNQVREYLVWRVLDGAIDWFALRAGAFERLPTSPEGWLKSMAFPGLWLDSAALLRDDGAVVLDVLQQGLNSPEHAAFVAELAARRKPS